MANRNIYLITAALFFGLACVIATPNSPHPDGNSIQTSVASTLTALAHPDIPSLTPTNTHPPCLPNHPGAQTLPLPAGLGVGKNQVITLFDANGTKLADRPATGFTSMDAGRMHIAGNLGMGVNNIPLVFITFENTGTIKQNINNVVSVVATVPNVMLFTGAEGNPFLSWVTIDMTHQWTNRLFASDLASIPGAQPLWTWTPPQNGLPGNALQPLAIHMVNGQATGIWFAYTMQGIGDILFAPWAGLEYFDLASHQTTEFIPSNSSIGGLSPDQSFVAFGPGQAGHPGHINGSFTIKNLITCQTTQFPLEADSNMGGGDMIFSPDGQMVAWEEASGPSPFEANFRIKVAHTSGDVFFNAPIANMKSLLGGETPQYLTPVGWISNHILVLQANLGQAHPSVLILWAPDPAQPIDPVLGANQSIVVGDGSFMGFVYP